MFRWIFHFEFSASFNFNFSVCFGHTHLSNAIWLIPPALFASLVLLMAAAKKKKPPWKTGASSRHMTNLKQSILTFDIYGFDNEDKSQLILIACFGCVLNFLFTENWKTCHKSATFQSGEKLGRWVCLISKSNLSSPTKCDQNYFSQICKLVTKPHAKLQL